MKKKIYFLHCTGTPIIKGKEIGFTEGGMVHTLFTSAKLARDCETSIICPNLPGERKERAINYKGVKVICLGNSRWIKWSKIGDFSFFRETFKYIKKGKPDILIANNLLMSVFLTFLPESITRATKIGIIHHLYHTQHIDSSSKSTLYSIGILEKLAIHLIRLNKIGVVNPGIKNYLIKQGYPETKFVIVGNGVDIDNYFFSEKKIPHSLIYIGRIAELKGVSSLIDVIFVIKKEFPDITLSIIGNGPKFDEVKKRAKDLKVSSNLTMYGYLTEREKINLLAKSAIYVSNSRMEGFGIPLVEAMATGTVPVVSNIYAHRYVFQGKEVGYLVNNNQEMAKRIIELLNSGSKRKTLARNGRQLVEERWTWKKVSEKYRELLKV